jgi:serine/threonine-protein kinase
MSQDQKTDTAETPSLSRAWWLLALLGAADAGLAFYLWRQLMVARGGGTPICGFSGESDCAVLWDVPAAAAVHHWTGLPVAGWGLVWGLAALLLPLAALRLANRREILAGAVRAVAAGGVLAAAWLAGVSVKEGVFCAGCVTTYLLVAAYTVVAYGGLREVAPPRAGRGLGLAALATAAVYLALLYPGLRTPQSTSVTTRQAVAEAGESGEQADAEDGGESPEGRWRARDDVLGQVFESFGPEVQQLVADALYEYENAPALPPREPRFLIGPADAPVRLTDFTDILCPACAQLHANLETFRQALPEGSFALEPRQFPLDARCNALIQGERPDGELRCAAARALICLEGRPEYFEAQKKLFETQRELTEAKLFGILGDAVPEAELRRCIASPQTAAKLADDIAYAESRGITGTPLVLLGGRKAPAFGPFLYALLFAGGDTTGPAFDLLPPPSPEVMARVAAGG